MNNKKVIRFIAILLALVLAGSVIVSAVSYAVLGAESESALDELQQEAANLEKKAAEVEARINAMRSEHLTVLEKKEILDSQVVIAEEIINNLEQQAVVCNQLEQELQEDIRAAREVENTQLEVYGQRVRNTEENGIISYFSVIFNAVSFADLLSRIDFVRQVWHYDEKVFLDYQLAKQGTADIEEKLASVQESHKALTEQTAAALRSRQEKAMATADAFGQLIAQGDAYIAMCDEIQNLQPAFDKAVASSDSDIVRATNRRILVGTGVFAIPLEGSPVVREDFGSLLNEEYLYYRLHYGVDLAAEYGTNVLASDSGTVTLTGYNPSYGRYIVISHGNSFMTVYAHLADLEVEAGDEVTQRQIIGTVGTTGAAAEAGLHFEIRYEDEAVNPMRFLNG